MRRSRRDGMTRIKRFFGNPRRSGFPPLHEIKHGLYRRNDLKLHIERELMNATRAREIDGNHNGLLS